MTVDPRAGAGGARASPRSASRRRPSSPTSGPRSCTRPPSSPRSRSGIPVRILNSLQPDGARARSSRRAAGRRRAGEPRAIAFKKGISVILISQPRMLMAYGFVARVFEVFDRHRTPVDLIATSEVSISLTVDDPTRAARGARTTWPRSARCRSCASMAIVSVVGRGFVRRPGLAGAHLPGPARRERGDDLVRRLGREPVVRGRGGGRGARRAARCTASSSRARQPRVKVRRGRLRARWAARWRRSLRERGHEPVVVGRGAAFPAGCPVGIDFTRADAVVDNVAPPWRPARATWSAPRAGATALAEVRGLVAAGRRRPGPRRELLAGREPLLPVVRDAAAPARPLPRLRPLHRWRSTTGRRRTRPRARPACWPRILESPTATGARRPRRRSTAPCPTDAFHVAAVRAGGIVGEHTVGLRLRRRRDPARAPRPHAGAASPSAPSWPRSGSPPAAASTPSRTSWTTSPAADPIPPR